MINNSGRPSIDKPWLKYYSDEAINAPLPGGSAYSYMHDRNFGRRNEIALNYFGKKITHRQMWKKIEMCSKALIASGVCKGDFVNLCMLAIPEAVYLFYAINRIGAIANFVKINATEKQIRDQINGTESSLIFAVDIVAEKISSAVGQEKECKIILVPIAQSMPLHVKTGAYLRYVGKKTCQGVTWKSFLKRSENKHDFREISDADRLAVLEYTGGTTGDPKGVMLSNRAVNALALNYILADKVLEFRKGEKMLDIIPPFLAYGLFFGIHMPLCVGLEVILCPDPDPKKFPAMLLKYRPNHFSGGPMHIRSMMEDSKIRKTDLSFIITAAWGGDGISRENEESATEFLKIRGAKFGVLSGYGMTETAASFCTKTHYLPEMIPFVKNNIMVRDVDTGEELPYGKVGELCLSGPSLMSGYWQHQKETEEIIFEAQGRKWIKSGDLGYVTEEGFVHITGRIKRIFYVIGENKIPFRVYPMEVERVISINPVVIDCAVVGKEELDHGYEVVAYLILNSDRKEVDSEEIIMEIRKICEKELPEHARPQEYFLLEEFPKTIAGKTDYRELERRASE